VSALKLKLVETCEEKLPSFTDLECGYFEKCSNAKGWIEDNQDLQAMYRYFRDNDEITLWCEGCPSEDQHKKTKTKTERKGKLKTVRRKLIILRMVLNPNELLKRTELMLQDNSYVKSTVKCTVGHSSACGLVCTSVDSMTAWTTPRTFHCSLVATKSSKCDSLTEALTSAATAVVGILTHKDCAESTTGKMSPAK